MHDKFKNRIEELRRNKIVRQLFEESEFSPVKTKDARARKLRNIRLHFVLCSRLVELSGARLTTEDLIAAAAWMRVLELGCRVLGGDIIKVHPVSVGVLAEVGLMNSGDQVNYTNCFAKLGQKKLSYGVFFWDVIANRLSIQRWSGLCSELSLIGPEQLQAAKNFEARVFPDEMPAGEAEASYQKIIATLE